MRDIPFNKIPNFFWSLAFPGWYFLTHAVFHCSFVLKSNCYSRKKWKNDYLNVNSQVGIISNIFLLLYKGWNEFFPQKQPDRDSRQEMHLHSRNRNRSWWTAQNEKNEWFNRQFNTKKTSQNTYYSYSNGMIASSEFRRFTKTAISLFEIPNKSVSHWNMVIKTQVLVKYHLPYILLFLWL